MAQARKGRRKGGMGLDTLARICERAAADAVGAGTSAYREKQRDGLEYYKGEKPRRESENRSNVVSTDVAQVIDWTMPDLMRILKSGEDIVSFVPTDFGDEHNVEDATFYFNHLLMQENPGRDIVHDFAFDGLSVKIGVIRVDWVKPAEAGPIQRFDGYTAEQVVELHEGGAHEIVELEERYAPGSELATYSLGWRKKPYGTLTFRQVRPEDFLVSKGARHIDQTRFDGPEYVAEVERAVTRSELLTRFPEKKALIETLKSSKDAEDTATTGPAAGIGRHDEEGDEQNQDADDNPSMDRFDLYDEYIKVDYDGDGIAELKRVCRVQKHILFCGEADDNPFGVWTPYRLPHQVIGLSQADKLFDLQEAKTILWRNAIDSARDASSPIAYVNEEKKVNTDDLVNIIEGATRVVRGMGSPDEALRFTTQPDVAESSYRALEYAQMEREGRTGVSRQSQGLDPDVLAKSGVGINLVQEAGAGVRELIADNFVAGICMLAKKGLRLLVKHQDQVRRIWDERQWRALQPANWNPDMAVKAHVGNSVVRAEKKIGYLQLIGTAQREIIANIGPSPLANFGHVSKTMRTLVREMGWKNPDAFFGEVDENFQPQTPPDPKVALEEKKLGIDMQKLQMEGQHKQAELQQKGEFAIAELMMKERISLREMAMQERIKEREMNMNAQLQRQQLALEDQREGERARREDSRDARNAWREDSRHREAGEREERLGVAKLRSSEKLAKLKTDVHVGGKAG